MTGCEGPLIKKRNAICPTSDSSSTSIGPYREFIIVTVGSERQPLVAGAGLDAAGGPLQCKTVFRFRRV